MGQVIRSTTVWVEAALESIGASATIPAHGHQHLLLVVQRGHRVIQAAEGSHMELGRLYEVKPYARCIKLNMSYKEAQVLYVEDK